MASPETTERYRKNIDSATGTTGGVAITEAINRMGQDDTDTHAAIAAAHHTKYTDSDALSALIDDVTSDPLIDADTAADGTEDSAARKDHVHPKHHTKYTGAEAVSAVNAAGLALAENLGWTLDPSLSADGQYDGIVEAGTAGAALAFGEVVYQAAGDGRWELAKADVAATSDGKIGICILVAVGDASATTILLIGKVRADAKFPSFSVRRPVYISAATAGLLTTTAPSGTTNFVVRIVGYANTADELYFKPDNTYIELA